MNNTYLAGIAIIAANYGEDHQLNKLLEELGEAVTAVSRFTSENSYLRERCSQTREHPRFLFT